MKLTQKIPLCMLIVATCLKFSSVRPSVRLSVRHEFLLSHISPTLLYLVMWNLHRRYLCACRLGKRIWNFPPSVRLSVRPSVCLLEISVISSYAIIARDLKLTQENPICMQIRATCFKFHSVRPSVRLSVRHKFLLSHLSPTLLYLGMWNLHSRYLFLCRLQKRV